MKLPRPKAHSQADYYQGKIQMQLKDLEFATNPKNLSEYSKLGKDVPL